MSGWVGMMEGKAEPVPIQVESEPIPNTQPSPSLLVDNTSESSVPQVPEEIVPQPEKQALPVEEVKQKRGRGRPRKYPKPDGVATPPPHPPPII